MRKVAVFVEGQSEQIFVRSLLERTLDPGVLSFGCLRLYADRLSPVPYSYPNPSAAVYFLIVDVGNDERVLSAVKEREQNLFRRGYERILALRDMYCEAYRRRSGGRIDDEVTQAFARGAESTIADMAHPCEIAVHFAVMELEAWFLAMFRLLQQAHSGLTDELLEQELGFRLSEIDPQTYFYRPSADLDRILRLVGERYRKSRGDVEKICSHLMADDVATATAGERCRNLALFFEELRRCCE